MPVPAFQELIKPVLEALVAGDGRPDIIRSRLARDLNLTPSELAERPPTSPTPVFTNRVAWALAQLRRQGFIDKSGDQYVLTELGRRAVAVPGPLDLRTLADIARGVEPAPGRDPLAGFTEPVPFTVPAVSQSPEAAGVHVVFDDAGDVVYVGHTGNLRQGLLQHLQSDRQASVLREQVGAMLDQDARTTPEEEIREWLARCAVSWRSADDPRGLKAQLVRAFAPRFNRAAEATPTGLWWVNQGRSYEPERAAGIVWAGTEGAQLAHHLNVGRMRPGDAVLHNRNGAVVALGEVVAEPERASRPHGSPEERQEQGLLTRVEYFPLDQPLRLPDLPERDGDEGPFDRNGAVKQGYLYPLDLVYGDEVRERFADRWPPGSPWSEGERRFWLFQANPEQWSLVEHLAEMPPGQVDDWIVTRHRSEMRPGDGVALWETGPQGGVYALAHLVGTPVLKPVASYRPETVGESEHRVDLRVDRHVLPPITRAQARDHPVLRDLAVLSRPFAGTNLPVTREQWRALLAATPLEPGTPPVGPRSLPRSVDGGLAPVSLAGLAERLYLPESFLARTLRLLEDKGQVVFYGPPGTGKTYVARELADHLAHGGGTVDKVQFHPSYAYEDFVEGYRPRLVDGQVTYEVVDGPLKRIAAAARERRHATHVMLIDELNRANVAKVLGELLFLLEYRDEELRLQYSETRFALPRNVKIIATMNTADRSVALIDAALRRRFHFVPFFPHLPPIQGLLRRWLADRQPEMLWVADVVDRANEELGDRNLAIGPSHFLKTDLTDEAVGLAWASSVLPFLEEYFFADHGQVARFELDRLRGATARAATASAGQDGSDPAAPDPS